MPNRYEGYGKPEKQNKDEINNKGLEKEIPSDPYDLYTALSREQNQKPVEVVSCADLSSKNDATQLADGIVTIDDLLSELDNLVGLNRVKSEIKGLIQFIKVQELRRQKEISISKPSLHSVFYGSPGTGKTTIARLYGQLLSAMGLLSKGHLVETDRSGLVGGYVGQAAIKTDEKIKEAMGGILFIDEAYSLAGDEDSHWDYGEEAIAILLKRMEDYRDDLVVIVAGYPEPMARFLSSNEGLRSRFSTYIHFEDYSPQELAEIFKRLCEKENYIPTVDALDFVFSSIDYNYSIRDKTFGNARFIRNLFETVIKNQAIRIGETINEPTLDELKTILPSDIPFVTPTDTKVIQT